MTMLDEFAFLRSVPPPEAVEPISQSLILEELVAGYISELQDWDGNVEDPVHGIARAEALREKEERERTNSLFLQGFVPTATGTNLDNLAATYAGIARNPGETDDELRVRIPASNALIAVGTPESIKAFAIESTPGVNDVVSSTSWTSTTGPTITVYAAKAGGVALSATERSAMQTYLNHANRKLLGTTVTVTATTETAYTITVALTYDSREYNLDALQDAARASLYGYIDEHVGIGQGIYVNGIIAAASVEGVLSASVSAPTADLAGTAGTIYKAAKTTTGVSFGTATDVAP